MQAYYESVFRDLVANGSLADLVAVDVSTSRWYELDDHRDLEIAEFMFMSRDRQFDYIQSLHGSHWRYGAVDHAYLYNLHFPPPAMLDDLRDELADGDHQLPGRSTGARSPRVAVDRDRPRRHRRRQRRRRADQGARRTLHLDHDDPGPVVQRVRERAATGSTRPGAARSGHPRARPRRVRRVGTPCRFERGGARHAEQPDRVVDRSPGDPRTGPPLGFPRMPVGGRRVIHRVLACRAQRQRRRRRRRSSQPGGAQEHEQGVRHRRASHRLSPHRRPCLRRSRACAPPDLEPERARRVVSPPRRSLSQ